MRIKSIAIRHFAGLSGVNISFEQDFKLFYGANETGKTTIMHFIRMMLYGGDSKLRKQSTPLSGEKMGGSLIFETKGNIYQLDRNFGKTRRSDCITITNLSTGKTVSAADEPGEIFLQMNEDSFIRSCYVGTIGSISGEKGSEEMRQKLQNLVSTGTESISVSAVEEHLANAAKQIQNKSKTQGLLIQKQEQLAKLQGELQQAKQYEDQRYQTDRSRENTLNQIKLLKEQLSKLQVDAQNQLQTQTQNQQLREQTLKKRLAPNGIMPQRKVFTACQQEINQLLLSAQQSDNRLQQSIMEQQMECQRLSTATVPLTRQAEQCETDFLAQKERLAAYSYKQRRQLPLFLIGGSILLLLGAAVTFFTHFITAAAFLCIVAILLTAISCILYYTQQKQLRHHKEQTKYAEERSIQAKTLLSEHHQQLKTAQSALELLQSNQNHISDECKARILSFLKPYGLTDFSQAKSLCDDLIACYDEWQMLSVRLQSMYTPQQSDEELSLLEQIRNLELQTATYNGILQTNRNEKSVSQLESEIDILKHKIDDLNDQYQALQLAIDILQNSFAQMQQQFGVILCDETRKLLSKLTCGRYEYVTIDRSFNLQTRQPQNTILTTSELLSNGTADQAYLALRLAISKLMAQTSNVSLPLFLDDSFIQYDDKRCKTAMQLIHHLTNTPEFSQAVLFTCHKRESEIYQHLK